MKPYYLYQCLAGLVVMQSVNASALESLPAAYHVVAKAYQVPVDILYAVALTESGRRYETSALPWPWALNIDGHSIYCQSKNEALLRIHQAVEQQKAIDIGLMQISWRWQQQRFTDAEQALIPLQNLKAGAAILREQFENTQDWWQAVGRYHDPGQDPQSLESAKHYRVKVRKRWMVAF